MDRLHAMNVFVAVAEEEGFAAGARRLRMSPPAVTRAVAALEEHLGVKLLNRTTRYVRATDAGQRYPSPAHLAVYGSAPLVRRKIRDRGAAAHQLSFLSAR